MMREAPEFMIELSARTVMAIDRETEWPGITIHRRCIVVCNRRRQEVRLSLLGRIDEVLKAIA